LNIPEGVVEEIDLESGEEEEDFEKQQRNEVCVKILQDIMKIVERSVLTPEGDRGAEAVEALSTTFLQNLVVSHQNL